MIIASIIIPAFDRLRPLQQTIASARSACAHLASSAEIVLVDDGSCPPIAESLPQLASDPLIRMLYQPNQGSMIARLAGLSAARGEYVLFLDSDDIISEHKLRLHCAALSADPSLVATYDDVGILTNPDDPASPVQVSQTFSATCDIAQMLLRVQPPPHGAVFRRNYLLRSLAKPVVPPERCLDPVGDIWLYYNLSIHAGRCAKIDAPLSLIGIHDQARYSQSWERLGCCALHLAERFMAATSDSLNPDIIHARRLVGECAFNSWRRLPRDFSPEYRRRQLAVWQSVPRGPLHRLGGNFFQLLARVLSPVAAARLLRLRNAPYSASRTVDDATLERLLNP